MKRNKRGKTEKGSPADGEAKVRHLPLSGKIIYLDVKDSRQAKTLEQSVGKLGATVERFLSKEVNYVISHSAPQRVHSQVRGHQESQGPESPAFVNTPSPFSATPSPSAAAPEGKIVPVSRGKTMAQIACSVRSPSPNNVVANAEKLGIKIVSVEAALKWLEKELAKLGHGQETDNPVSSAKKKRNGGSGYVKCRRLHQPFVKVEAASQQYRPVFRELPDWPHPNVETPASTCPFDGRGVAAAQQSVRGDRDGQASIGNWAAPHSHSGTQKRSRSGEGSSRLVGFPILTAGDLRRQRERRRQVQRRRGYCECCATKYDDIDEHVKEKSHKDFVRDKQNYEALDKLISDGPSTVAFLQSILLRHCKQHRSNKPACEEEEDDGSNDQVLTLKPCTPVKAPPVSCTAQDETSADLPAGLPGFRTPTRRPRHLFDSPPTKQRREERSPTGEARCMAGDQKGEDDDVDSNTNLTCSTPLQAVVIRRPGAKSVYPSPRRSKTPVGAVKVTERSMVFGHSPIGSLQALISEKTPAPAEASAITMELSSAPRKPDSMGKAHASQHDMEETGNKKQDAVQAAGQNPETVDTAGKETAKQDIIRDDTTRPVRGCTTRSRKAEIGELKLHSSQTAEEMPGMRRKRGRTEENHTVRSKSAANTTNVDQPCVIEAISTTTDSVKNCQDPTVSDDQGNSSDQPLLTRVPTPRGTGPYSEPKVTKVRRKQRKQDSKPQLMQPDAEASAECSQGSQSSQPKAKRGLLELENTPQKHKAKDTQKRRRSSSPCVQSPSVCREINQTPVKKTQQVEDAITEEEEMSSSPVFPRSVVHCSTPVVVTTRKLRHLASSQTVVHQRTEEASELLEKPAKSKTRRSIFQDSQGGAASRLDGGAEREEYMHEGSPAEKGKGRQRRRSKSQRSCNTDVSTEDEAEAKQGRGENSPSETSTGSSPATDYPQSLRGKLKDSQQKASTVDDGVSKSPALKGAHCQIKADGTREHNIWPFPTSAKKKVKLNGSWMLLSDHSMTRLLMSEPDDTPFEGFTGHDDGLPSDLTFEEASEVEVSDTEEREWVIDDQPSSDLDVQTLHNFLPTFSSPGKQSDSSWGEACDLYLNLSIQSKIHRQGARKSPRQVRTKVEPGKKRKRSRSRGREGSSPNCRPSKKSKREQRKSSEDAKCSSLDSQGACVPEMHTPTKRQRQTSRKHAGHKKSTGSAHEEGPVMCKVDEEVVFNYRSPQKSSATFSPLRIINGNVVNKTPEKVVEKRSPLTRRPLKLD